MTTAPTETGSLPPKVDPDSLALRAQPKPVTRLNRKVLIAGAGTVSLALLGITVWSLQPVQRKSAEQQPELHNVERVARAETIDALPQEYNIVFVHFQINSKSVVRDGEYGSIRVNLSFNIYCYVSVWRFIF